MKEQNNRVLDYTQMAAQQQFTHQVRQHLAQDYQAQPLALVHSYGCQQNVADAEKLQGILSQMGYGFTDQLEQADLILYNTCAVRENAELRVLGNVGALKHYKKRKPELIIILAGCMTQQSDMAQRLKKSYPHVDIVIGTNAWAQLPEHIYQKLVHGSRYIHDSSQPEDKEIVEGLPVRREGVHKAWVSIMYGCDNFCTYCIVPHVRGRERSRRPQDILQEIQELAAEGFREFTLLGQNVNSYGKGLEESITFARLLRQINEVPGEFRVRFMTSHPKDCTRELIDAMADCPKICNHLHLPVQCGSDRVLREMNRGYTTAEYLDLVDYARERIPDLSLTSDIIVGFPGETYEEFQETLDLIRRVKFDALYTFIYSRRSGTRAAQLEDPVPAQEKSRWFQELLAAQEEAGQGGLDSQVGKILRVLPEGPGKGEGLLTSRSDSNLVVEFAGDSTLVGSFCQVEITGATKWCLLGQAVP